MCLLVLVQRVAYIGKFGPTRSESARPIKPVHDFMPEIGRPKAVHSDAFCLLLIVSSIAHGAVLVFVASPTLERVYRGLFILTPEETRVTDAQSGE